MSAQHPQRHTEDPAAGRRPTATDAPPTEVDARSPEQFGTPETTELPQTAQPAVPAEAGTALPAEVGGAGLGGGILPRGTPPAVAVLAAALSAGLLFLLGWFSWPGLVALGLLLYVGGIWGLSRAVEGSRRATDRVVTALVTTAFVLAMVPLLSVVWTVVSLGARRFDVEFFTSTMDGVVGDIPGGAAHAIVGTLMIVGIAALISIPIGLMAAIYLVEYGRGALKRSLTFFVDVMTGIPSIVAGLFALTLFALFFGVGYRSALAGAVALSVLMIPVVVRSSEEMIKLVPNELREASYALGVPKWLTILKVVLPTSAAGIATGITISIARVIGETAPLLVTIGLVTGFTSNPFDGRVASLPTFTYFQYATPTLPLEASLDRAWAGALTLMVIVMLLNAVARLISYFFAPKTGR